MEARAREKAYRMQRKDQQERGAELERQAIGDVAATLRPGTSNASARMAELNRRVKARLAAGRDQAVLDAAASFTIGVQNVKVEKQPGDGSCLFHALAFGMHGATSKSDAAAVRKQIVEGIRNDPTRSAGETTAEQWIQWETNLPVEAYADRMARGAWGGAIEIATFALANQRCVEVYVRRSGDSGRLHRIVAFGEPTTAARIRLLFDGGSHYDCIVDNGHVEGVL